MLWELFNKQVLKNKMRVDTVAINLFIYLFIYLLHVNETRCPPPPPTGFLLSLKYFCGLVFRYQRVGVGDRENFFFCLSYVELSIFENCFCRVGSYEHQRKGGPFFLSHSL